MSPNFLALAKLKLLSFEPGQAQHVKTPCKLDSSLSFILVKIKIMIMIMHALSFLVRLIKL